MRPEGVKYPDRTGVSVNAYRTYRVYVNGKLLVGKHKDEDKMTKDGKPAPLPVRYFHGSPIAAARKVIGSMFKRKEIDKNKPVMIKLFEVTKGYRPLKGKFFEYQYWGMREGITNADIAKKKNVMTRGGE